MEILKFPHPSLFKSCTEVTVFDQELKTLLDSMWETMKANNGMGLAANQVDLPWHMFVMQGPDGKRINLVNPYILHRSVVSANLKEGCLSAPGETIVVPERAEWVQLVYDDENGKEHKTTFTGIHSVCVQHEMEHLDGMSFMENSSIPKVKRKQLARKWGFKLK